MTRLIILRGYPGSGKTTIGKQLAKHGHGTFIDHNAILNFVADITGDDDGIYEEIGELELAMTVKLLKKGTSVIVARGFSSQESIKKYLNKATAEVLIIRLAANESLLAQRVQAPDRSKDFNPTITAEALTSWIKDNPLEDIEDEKIIDAAGSVDVVVEGIEKIL